MKIKLQKLSTLDIDATNDYGEGTLDGQCGNSGESSRNTTTDALIMVDRLVDTGAGIGKTAYEVEKAEKDTVDLAKDV